MGNKDEAMGNFKNAINNSSQKKEEEAEKRKEEKQENEQQKKERFQEQKNKPTEQEQPEQKPNEEELEQERQADKISYNIYDEDVEDEEKEDKNGNNMSSKKKKQDDDNENEDSQDDNKENDKENSNDTNNDAGEDAGKDIKSDADDKDSNIDDDSSKNSGTGKSQSDKGKNDEKSSSKTDGNSSEPQNTETYRPNSSASNTATNSAEAETANQAAQTGAETAGQAAQAGATAEKTAEAGAGASKLLGGVALFKVILIALVIIIVLIIVIGFLSFFISGAGLIREKLLKFADSFWSGWVGFWRGDEHAVRKEEIINIADYLEEMGYDLVNYGFLDTLGKNVEIEKKDDGTETIKNAKGKVILKREIDSDTNELKISKIQSKYILAYLTAENRTYIIANQNKSVASIFANMGDAIEDFFSGEENFSDANWGTGMIYIEGMNEETANNMGLEGASGNGKSRNVKIDRENKKMILTIDGYTYQYDLDGWTGRYGMSIEFLLTLHMATMAPDFVYDVATAEEFDTKVHVALYEIGTSVEIVYKLEDGKYAKITAENYSSFGLTDEQWAAIQKYNNDEVKTYTPFITKVTNHWFNNLDFAGCYTEVENDPNTTEDDEKFTYTYQYVGLGEENDVLADNENLYVREVRKKDIFQIKEPKVIDNSKQIKKMLLGATDEENSENTNEDYKYYIYTGSPMSKDQNEREKDYIIKKAELENGENEYTMNTKTFTYAFAILENVHSEDAEYILRDLKELFRKIGIDDETLDADQGNAEVKPLTWPIKDYKPVVWDPVYDAESSVITIRHKTESTLGFDKDKEVVMPAAGEIIQIAKGENEKDGDSIKIRCTGTDRQDIENSYIYISGIKVDDGVNTGSTYSAGQKIGKTIEKDIRIIMTDSKRESVYNVDQYIQPEEWTFESADEITESNFGNDIFGNHGGENNGGGNNSPYVGTFSEEFYWYLATLEGMPVTTDLYFTNANGGVNWLPGESYITVGPGIYMLPENCQKFRNKGWTNFNEYSLSSIFPKDITVQVFYENIDAVKTVIENYMRRISINAKANGSSSNKCFPKGNWRRFNLMEGARCNKGRKNRK